MISDAAQAGVNHVEECGFAGTYNEVWNNTNFNILGSIVHIMAEDIYPRQLPEKIV